MDSIADSDRQAIEDAALDPRAERGGHGGRTPGARPSERIPWTAWAGFGSNWLSAPDSYWRRRFIILAGGLAVLCLITWAMSALLGPAKPIERSGAAQAANNRMTLPPAAYGLPSTPSPVTPSAGIQSSGTPSPTPTPGVSAPAIPSASGPGASVPATPASATPALVGPSPSVASAQGQCRPASIVLSLFSPQPKYGPSQQPRFTVYVVSTAPGTCQLSYLPPFAHVIVTRKGEVIWDSASCAPAAGAAGATAGGTAQQMPLTEGVPKVTTLSWNRKATIPGCAGSLPSGASGTFDAVAMAGGKSSPVRTITLTRK
jgi:hypothetical protein